MKLSVLGASGGCGKLLVEQAASKGHEVTAVVRSAEYQAPKGVKVVRGSLTDEKTLREGIAGSDAVASALGLRLKSIAPWAKPEQADFLSQSTPALIAAMKASGVTRGLSRLRQLQRDSPRLQRARRHGAAPARQRPRRLHLPAERAHR